MGEYIIKQYGDVVHIEGDECSLVEIPVAELRAFIAKLYEFVPFEFNEVAVPKV